MSNLIHCLGLSSWIFFFFLKVASQAFCLWSCVPTYSSPVGPRHSVKSWACVWVPNQFSASSVYLYCKANHLFLKHKGVGWGGGSEKEHWFLLLAQAKVANLVRIYILSRQAEDLSVGSHYSLGHPGLLSNICSLQWSPSCDDRWVLRASNC